MHHPPLWYILWIAGNYVGYYYGSIFIVKGIHHLSHIHIVGRLVIGVCFITIWSVVIIPLLGLDGIFFDVVEAILFGVIVAAFHVGGGGRRQKRKPKEKVVREEWFWKPQQSLPAPSPA